MGSRMIKQSKTFFTTEVTNASKPKTAIRICYLLGLIWCNGKCFR